MTNALPVGVRLRPAMAGDIWRIRQLVFSSMLDPTQVRWQQFWVIEQEETLIACGQLRNFPDAQELGSMVVVKDWRNRGLGSFLVQHLIQQATQPLYLECLGERRTRFYERFGFVPVSWERLPVSLQRKFGVSRLAAKVLRLPVKILQYLG